MAAQYTLNRGIEKVIWDGAVITPPVNSAEYMLPTISGGPHEYRIRWRYFFSSAPVSVSVVLQGSTNPNEGVPSWFELDTGTDIGGESREVVVNVRAVRIRLAAQNGGGNFSARILI